jgi:hypothetical protein
MDSQYLNNPIYDNDKVEYSKIVKLIKQKEYSNAIYSIDNYLGTLNSQKPSSMKQYDEQIFSHIIIFYWCIKAILTVKNKNPDVAMQIFDD